MKEHLEPIFIPKEVIHEVIAARSPTEEHPAYPDRGIKSYGFGQESYTYRGHQVYQHTGGLAGQLSLFARIPDKGIGFMMATNQDELGTTFNEIIAYKIFDHLLGLPPIDWKKRSMNEAFYYQESTLGRFMKRPDHPRKANPVPKRFSHPAYGKIHLEHVSKKHDRIVDMLGYQPDYIAHLDHVLMTDIVFRHVDGPVYQWHGMCLFPEVYANGTVQEEVFSWLAGKGPCVINENGIGFFGSFWGSGDEEELKLKVDEKDPKISAEVWFDRL